MKKIIFIILISFFLFGCHYVEQVDYSKIPMLYNNYKNGYYEYTDELPHMDVLAYACEVGDFLPMSNYMNCYQLKEEYRNNDKIEFDLSALYLDEEVEVWKSVGIGENIYNTPTQPIKTDKEEFNGLLSSIEVIQYYPDFLEVDRTTRQDTIKKTIGYSYTIDNIKCSIDVSYYDESEKGYFSVYQIKTDRYERLLSLNAYVNTENWDHD